MNIRIVSQEEIEGLIPLTELETQRVFNDLEKKVAQDGGVISVSREGDEIIFETIANPVCCYLRKKEKGGIVFILKELKKHQ